MELRSFVTEKWFGEDATVSYRLHGPFHVWKKAYILPVVHEHFSGVYSTEWIPTSDLKEERDLDEMIFGVFLFLLEITHLKIFLFLEIKTIFILIIKLLFESMNESFRLVILHLGVVTSAKNICQSWLNLEAMSPFDRYCLHLVDGDAI